MGEFSKQDVHEHGAVVSSSASPRMLVTHNVDQDEFRVWRALDPSQQYWQLLATHIADTSAMSTLDVAMYGNELITRLRFTW